MVGRRQPPSAATVVTSPQLSDDELRVAVAMREIRRGSAMQRFRDLVYGSGDTGASLDLAQHDALDVVVAAGGVGMGDLATALRVDPSTVTRTVARLEAAGLVARERSPSDARHVVVAATARGAALHDELRTRAHLALGTLFAGFDDDEVATLADLLERLVAGLDDLAAAGQAGLRQTSVSD